MNNILIAVSMIAAVSAATPTAAQQYRYGCVVDPDVPITYDICAHYWRYLGGPARNGHVSPYQDEYGRDVGEKGHMYR
jgi:hypothetical protein